MLTHSDTTALLDETTRQLSQPDSLTPQAGVALIDHWVGPLGEAENTEGFARQLQELKTLLADTSPDADAIRSKLVRLADDLTEFSAHVGSEGELPALLTGLASTLRQAG